VLLLLRVILLEMLFDVGVVMVAVVGVAVYVAAVGVVIVVRVVNVVAIRIDVGVVVGVRYEYTSTDFVLIHWASRRVILYASITYYAMLGG